MSALSKGIGWQEFSLTELVPEARQRLVELGAPLLLTEAEGRLALAERKIGAFEQKYGTTLARLRRNGLPDDASIEMHEDFIEWSGWQRTREEAGQTLASLQPLLEKSLALATAI
ncbi:MAG: hypothetical protein KAX26_00785 [Anaerolineae bacterium]|nr:hypothetical protein [Anaerolineae bacterium]